MLKMILALLVILGLGGFLFVKLSPEFGGKITKEQLLKFEQSPQYAGDKFKNAGGVEMNMSFSKFLKIGKLYLKKNNNTVPDQKLPVVLADSSEIANYSGPTRLIWFGHSAFLLQINAKNILIDPMFGDVPAPHPWLGTKRFSGILPIEVEKIPRIDAVIFSHDHYDHLDYNSVKLLKNKVNHFYVPLGLGAHLREWEVDASKITELDWWESTRMDDLNIIATPAQHFSGRGLGDRDQTLWASWIVQSETEKIYFSGDSGYGSHFAEIGKKYGPFDFAMIECGQYNDLWKEIHMMPEQSVQAAQDLNAKLSMPIHWGAFKLALHPWTDPVERYSAKANDLGVNFITPKIGEKILIKDSLVQKQWW